MLQGYFSLQEKKGENTNSRLVATYDIMWKGIRNLQKNVFRQLLSKQKKNKKKIVIVKKIIWINK